MHTEYDEKDLVYDEDEEIKKHLYIFDNIHTCEQAVQHWDPDWSECPLCKESINEKGKIIHKHKSEITH